MTSDPSPHTTRIRALALWGLVLAFGLAGLALSERRALVGEFTTKSATLHRLASQRADQHDAHMTSLSAIFVAGGAARQDLFLDVAATIKRFYPRIISVNIVALDPSGNAVAVPPASEPEWADTVREVAALWTGALQIAQSPAVQRHYLLVKRSPNTETGRHALGLAIDADQLLASDDPFWDNPSVSRRLLLPEGAVLTGTLASDGASFTKPLGSASQPLILEASRAIHLRDLLPLGKTVATVLLVSGLFALVLLGLGQRARTKAAEREARLSAQDARLAHASRVNAMGEMASGMAHELAQPLTAILSQSQAGRHLVKRGDVARLETVLNDTIAQAQRASDILDRLRRWSKPNRSIPKPCVVNDAARSVEQLLAQDVRAAGASVCLDLSPSTLLIDADPVELEQVIFNLVRNALDASDGPRITLKTRQVDGDAIVWVLDDGPGIPDDMKARIFEPFVTGKPDGTGLGLSLCQRLVEDMGGDLELVPDTELTSFRLSIPLSRSKDLT